MLLTDLRYIRCFPNSYTPLAAELFSDETVDTDEAGWSDYNFAIRASKHVSGLIFANWHKYAAYLKLAALEASDFPTIITPDNALILLFKNTDWTHKDFNFNHPDHRTSLLINVGLIPAPPSTIGEDSCRWIHEPQEIPEHTIAEPLKATANPLRRAHQPEEGAIPISGLLSFSMPRKMPLMANGLLDHRSKTALAGEPKIGKSNLALDWAFCLATGKPFLDHAVYRPARVLYVQFEITEQRFQERLIRAGYAHKLTADTNTPLFIRSLPSLHLNIDAGVNQLNSIISSCNPDVVFLDPLYKIHNLEENDNSRMQAELYDRIDEVMHDNAVSSILIHHVNKSDRKGWTRVRGASALIGWVDSLLLLEREEESAAVSCTALLRNGEEFSKNLGWRDGRFQVLAQQGGSALQAANVVSSRNVRDVRTGNA